MVPPKRKMAGVLNNMRWGLSWGFKMAVAATTLATAVLLIGGPSVFEGRPGYFQIVRFYILGGMVGGLLLGLSRPLTRYRIGIAFVGICVISGVFFSFLLFAVGMSNLKTFDYLALAFFSLVGGPLGAEIIRRGTSSNRNGTNSTDNRE